MPMVPYHTPWKHQKTCFRGVIERGQWQKMGKLHVIFVNSDRKTQLLLLIGSLDHIPYTHNVYWTYIKSSVYRTITAALITLPVLPPKKLLFPNFVWIRHWRDVYKASRTSPERLMYVQITSCVQGYNDFSTQTEVYSDSGC